MEKRDSMVIYRSFYDAIKQLSVKDQAAVWDAIFNRGFYFEKPNLKGMAYAVWLLIEPQIEANIKRYENGVKFGALGGSHGVKGGRPKNPQKTLKKPTNVNVDVNEDGNKFKPPTLEQVKKYFDEKGYDAQAAERAFLMYDANDWKDSHGNQVKNWKMKMVQVWFKPEHKLPPDPTKMGDEERMNYFEAIPYHRLNTKDRMDLYELQKKFQKV